MFDKLHRIIRLRQMRMILGELCEGRSCRNCPCFIYDKGLDRFHCAMVSVVDLAIDKWGVKEEK